MGSHHFGYLCGVNTYASTASGPDLTCPILSSFRAFLCQLLISKPYRVYVAFPRISQHGVNASTLEVQSLVLTNPTPTSFYLKQVSITRSNSSYHPDLDAFNASLSLNGTGSPYAYITIPATHATAVAYSIVNQTVQIVDPVSFAGYTTALMNSEEVAVAVQGRTTLHEMRFPTTTVSYDKVTILKGKHLFWPFPKHQKEAKDSLSSSSFLQ